MLILFLGLLFFARCGRQCGHPSASVLIMLVDKDNNNLLDSGGANKIHISFHRNNTAGTISDITILDSFQRYKNPIQSEQMVELSIKGVKEFFITLDGITDIFTFDVVEIQDNGCTYVQASDASFNGEPLQTGPKLGPLFIYGPKRK
jgi:hypothetical protein